MKNFYSNTSITYRIDTKYPLVCDVKRKNSVSQAIIDKLDNQNFYAQQEA